MSHTSAVRIRCRYMASTKSAGSLDREAIMRSHQRNTSRRLNSQGLPRRPYSEAT
jgi:hypothetical protein